MIDKHIYMKKGERMDKFKIRIFYIHFESYPLSNIATCILNSLNGRTEKITWIQKMILIRSA